MMFILINQCSGAGSFMLLGKELYYVRFHLLPWIQESNSMGNLVA